MRYVKGLGLAVIGTMALLLVGAGGASAAELYSTEVTVNSGTNLVISLESGTSALLSTTDTKTIVDTCTESKIEGEINPYTGGDVTGNLSLLSFGGCSSTTDVLANGSFKISSKGTVSGSGTVTTVNTSVSCRYGTGVGTTLGTGTTGKIEINAVINEQEPKAFLCPDTTKWIATYTVTSPHDLDVM
jgi:hypothetical protein